MDSDLTRTMLHDIDRDLASLEAGSEAEHGERLAQLKGSWQRLVQHLALGEAPAVRDCPFCGGVIMRAATRCVHCWKHVTPPGHER